eukprot:749918-Hanusia_phi.AAC.1
MEDTLLRADSHLHVPQLHAPCRRHQRPVGSPASRVGQPGTFLLVCFPEEAASRILPDHPHALVRAGQRLLLLHPHAPPRSLHVQVGGPATAPGEDEAEV